LSRNCNIDIGAVVLAAAVEACLYMQRLLLMSNMINDEGVITVARLVTQNVALDKIGLNRSCFGDAGEAAIVTANEIRTIVKLLRALLRRRSAAVQRVP